MPYGVETHAFDQLQEQVRELPAGDLGNSPRPYEGVLFAYLAALVTMLQLMRQLMEVCIERQETREYVRHFLPVYDEVAGNLRRLLDLEIREGLEADSFQLVELVYAIRESAIAAELVATSTGMAESEGAVEPEDHLETGTTVTNSLKQQIEKHSNRSWIKSVLHTINEVISVVRGCV